MFLNRILDKIVIPYNGNGRLFVTPNLFYKIERKCYEINRVEAQSTEKMG